MVCAYGGGGHCRREGVTYEVECKDCGDRYIGETSRNAYTRGLEHMSDLARKDEKSPLHMHSIEKHGGEKMNFTMKVTGIFGGDATKRQLREAVLIQQTNNLINRQDEWRQVHLPRVETCLY